jgi:zinc transporter ZupT
MSVGVSFGTGDMHNGIVLAIAIAFQNIPEGLAVALPLVALGYNKWTAVDEYAVIYYLLNAEIVRRITCRLQLPKGFCRKSYWK